MYYRQKILLGLIEAFGGSIKRTDCQKLLFMFCQYANKNHYDFHPHKYGAYSSVASQDKITLTQKGLLKDTSDFQIGRRQSFLDGLTQTDRAILTNKMIPMYKGLGGKALLRQVYVNYPAFTCRSEILTDTLNPSEIAHVRRAWNTDRTSCLFTIGYEGLTIDAYLNKLISNNIELVVDVRNNPQSMKFDFKKIKFRHHIENVSIKYCHIPELGIPSDKRQNLKSEAAYQQLFNEYEEKIIAKQPEAIHRLLTLFSQSKRIALTCFESEYRHCHRHKLADYLRSTPKFEAPLVHL
ncbi:MAG: DUF488 domain-containing protein [Dehalococcoidia bacterium]